MATINGYCDERFTSVRDTMAGNLDSGADVGSSVAIYLDGELVVDLWGGTVTDLDGNEGAWQQDTLVNVFSTTKTMCNLSALLLHDRGEIDVDAPVATYWPEFKANGKENISVKHLLSHTAGLSGWEEPITLEDLYDWDKCCELLAAQAPWWTPGDGAGYHAVTQGYLVGEVVRRVTGQSLGTFFRTEIAEPLGADMHIGTPAECDARIARLIPPPAPVIDASTLDPESVMVKTMRNPQVRAEASWTEPWRRAEIPAANGHGNARSVARVQSIVSHGGEVDGKRFLSAKTIDRIFESQSSSPDRVLMLPLNYGIGYGIVSPSLPVIPSERACFWGGWGGSVMVNDVAHRMTVAFVMNRMGEGTTGDARGVGVMWAAGGVVNG